MPYTGRPRGSGGPVPLIILGVIFAAVGFVLQGQSLMRAVGLPFLVLGVAFVVGGVAWAFYRQQQRRG